jgi:purine-nucleoside phosphorylase
MSVYDTLQASVAYIREHIKTTPQAGIILGSGLGGLIDAVEEEVSLPYSEIPNFPISTVEGHAGKLVFGKLAGKDVVLMAGRFHYYEGYDMQLVTFPVRVMKALGVDTLLISNACGSVNENYEVGDLMILNDHINLFPENPLRGPNDERLGTRFPDMNAPYDKKLIELAHKVAMENNIVIKEGVYAGLSGPTFETRAEYKWLQIIGADVVGMSTIPEVIVGVHSSMRIFAMSIITDMGVGPKAGTVTHEEVLAAANAAAPKLHKIMTGIVANL